MDDLVDVIEGSRVYIPCIYVINKIDQVCTPPSYSPICSVPWVCIFWPYTSDQQNQVHPAPLYASACSLIMQTVLSSMSGVPRYLPP